MDTIAHLLQPHQEVAICAALALGYWVGGLKVGTFSLGSVMGTLLAGILIGQCQVKIDPLVKTLFFDLFLFMTGYKIGPQFFRGFKTNVSQVALGTLLCVTGLLTALVLAKLMGYDKGTTAGLISGALTQSAVLGTATAAINQLAISAEEKPTPLHYMPVAYAVTYVVSTAVVAWWLASIGPKLLRVGLKAECKQLEAHLGGSTACGRACARRISAGYAAPFASRSTARPIRQSLPLKPRSSAGCLSNASNRTSISATRSPP